MAFKLQDRRLNMMIIGGLLLLIFALAASQGLTGSKNMIFLCQIIILNFLGSSCTSRPLGMTDGSIKDWQLAASSALSRFLIFFRKSQKI